MDRSWVGLLALAVAGCVMTVAGCGGPSKAERDAAASARVRAAQARTVAAQAGLGPDVQSFLARAAGASDVTATVVYDQGEGQTTTVMSRAPDRRIDIDGAAGPGTKDRLVIRGTETFVCHLNGARWACLSGVRSAPTGPFTPDAVSATIASLAQLSQTYDFTVSHRPIVGLDASCLAADRKPTASSATDDKIGSHAVICIAPSGVLLLVEDSGHPLTATSYRPSVPSGAFTLPARPTPATSGSGAAPTP